jgi:hypothetical protein
MSAEDIKDTIETLKEEIDLLKEQIRESAQR